MAPKKPRKSTPVSERWQPADSGKEGAKKIKIQRIKNERNRQVTFLKRKNGLLKKAMELSILCGCDVAVVVFNINGKLFEYSSTDPEKIFNRYANYTGPAERRRTEGFFDVHAAKTIIDFPKNEKILSQAASNAATGIPNRQISSQPNIPNPQVPSQPDVPNRQAPLQPNIHNHQASLHPNTNIQPPEFSFPNQENNVDLSQVQHMLEREGAMLLPIAPQSGPATGKAKSDPPNPSNSQAQSAFPLSNSLQGLLPDYPTHHTRADQENMDALYPIPFAPYSALPNPRYLDYIAPMPVGSSSAENLMLNPVPINNLNSSGNLLHPERTKDGQLLDEEMRSSVITTSPTGDCNQGSHIGSREGPGVQATEKLKTGPPTGSSVDAGIPLEGSQSPNLNTTAAGLVGQAAGWEPWISAGVSMARSDDTSLLPSHPIAEPFNRYDADTGLLSEVLQSSDFSAPLSENDPNVNSTKDDDSTDTHHKRIA